MIVTVHTVNAASGSVWTAEGTDTETGATITFGGDWRPMRDLAEFVAEEGEIDAQIEDWQILSTFPAAKFNDEEN